MTADEGAGAAKAAAPPRISSHRHAANAPCEDKLTVGDRGGDAFVGVWDGNGGAGVSEFVSRRALGCYFELLDGAKTATAAKTAAAHAMAAVFPKLDAELVAHGMEKQNHATLFCGSCAVAAHVEFAARRLTVGNLGDSRAVLGSFEGGALVTAALTRDHTAGSATEQARLVALHGSVSRRRDCHLRHPLYH